MHRNSNASPPRAGLLNQKTTSRETARMRAREIAQRLGRAPADVSQSDYEQAKRELTGTSDPVQQEALLTSTPPGSTGRKPPPAPAGPDRPARRGG